VVQMGRMLAGSPCKGLWLQLRWTPKCKSATVKPKSQSQTCQTVPWTWPQRF
jgi:hypothetical protein